MFGIDDAALAAAGANLIGTLFTNDTNKSLAADQQVFSANQASTIYQRGAEDLAKAGLNPILAYAKPAAVASYELPRIENPGASFTSGLSSAYRLESQRQGDIANARAASATAARTESMTPYEIDKIVSETENNKTTNDKLVAEIAQISFQSKLTQANTAESVQRTQESAARMEVHSAQAANTRQDTLLKVQQEAVQRVMEDLNREGVKLSKAQQIVAYAQAALNTQMAKTSLSQSAMNEAQTALAQANEALSKSKTTLTAPDSEFNQNNPNWSRFLAGTRRLFESIPGLSLLMKSNDGSAIGVKLN